MRLPFADCTILETTETVTAVEWVLVLTETMKSLPQSLSRCHPHKRQRLIQLGNCHYKNLEIDWCTTLTLHLRKGKWCGRKGIKLTEDSNALSRTKVIQSHSLPPLLRCHRHRLLQAIPELGLMTQ